MDAYFDLIITMTSGALFDSLSLNNVTGEIIPIRDRVEVAIQQIALSHFCTRYNQTIDWSTRAIPHTALVISLRDLLTKEQLIAKKIFTYSNESSELFPTLPPKFAILKRFSEMINEDPLLNRVLASFRIIQTEGAVHWIQKNSSKVAALIKAHLALKSDAPPAKKKLRK